MKIKSNTLIKLTALNLQKGEESEAFANYDKAIELDPDNEDIYCNRAQVIPSQNNFVLHNRNYFIKNCFKLKLFVVIFKTYFWIYEINLNLLKTYIF